MVKQTVSSRVVRDESMFASGLAINKEEDEFFDLKNSDTLCKLLWKRVCVPSPPDGPARLQEQRP